jgi:hypothetical protein
MQAKSLAALGSGTCPLLTAISLLGVEALRRKPDSLGIEEDPD